MTVSTAGPAGARFARRLVVLLFACLSAASAQESPDRLRYQAKPCDVLRYRIVRDGDPVRQTITWDLFCSSTNALVGARWVYRLQIEPFEGSVPPMPPRVYEEGGLLTCLPDGTLRTLSGALRHAEPGVLFPPLPAVLSGTNRIERWSAPRGAITYQGRLLTPPGDEDGLARLVLAHTFQPNPMSRLGVRVDYTFDTRRGRVSAAKMETVDVRNPENRAVHRITLDPAFKVSDDDLATLLAEEGPVFEAISGYDAWMARAETPGRPDRYAAMQAGMMIESALKKTRTIFLRNELLLRQKDHEQRVSRLPPSPR